MSQFAAARRQFHVQLLKTVWSTDENGVPTNADKDSSASVAIARGVMAQFGAKAARARVGAQRSGNLFEAACTSFLKETFLQLGHLRPGDWRVESVTGRNRMEIAKYEQFKHLAALARAAAADRELKAALGSDYVITPDIVVSRAPESDAVINAPRLLVDETIARNTALRRANNADEILHASISCKWTMRSDRSQNSRTEALNLVKNRKGRVPHIVVVTAEPLPSRIASIALGTGEIDCVYHFALPELRKAVLALPTDDSAELIETMVAGRRLRDISDLPLDLAV